MDTDHISEQQFRRAILVMLENINFRLLMIQYLIGSTHPDDVIQKLSKLMLVPYVHDIKTGEPLVDFLLTLLPGDVLKVPSGISKAPFSPSPEGSNAQ